METNPQNDSREPANLGPMRQDSESFGTVPKASEPFRTVRNDSEPFRTVPNASERKENHILTVREVARMFEAAGVARTERSIVKWCRRLGNEVPRLDSYFDPNERKYYITPQSVELAIAEEQAKAAKVNASSEPVGSVPNDSARAGREGRNIETDQERVEELEKEVMDLRITNRAKDYFIDQFNKERQSFAEERKEFVSQLVSANRRVGELENQLLLTEPTANKVRRLEVRGDTPALS
ncbi:MAG: hypothetical protein EPO07_04330 [Verrucomicrobia bacterium]|nr:MAG: hypothetical protein EPO07_04330 [Verrucomicrobiota bacterium]